MTTALSDAGILFANGDTQAYPSVPVRQTVLFGPVDSSGLPAFGGSTGSTTVTTSGTLIATAANGVSNRIGSIVNPSWTGLSTNGTMYLGLTVNADGTCTPFSTALAPIYQWGGTFSTTLNQSTFNIQAMQMQVGNGSVAAPAYNVFVGEVTVASGVVSAIVWYALMGRYVQPLSATLPGTSTATNVNHNIGTIPLIANVAIVNKTAELGFSVGDVYMDPATQQTAASWSKISTVNSAKTSSFSTGNGNPWQIMHKTSPGSYVQPTAANWYYQITALRGW